MDNLIIRDYIEPPPDEIQTPISSLHQQESTAIRRLGYQMILHIFKARFFLWNARISADKWKRMNCCRRTLVVLLEVPLDFVRRLTIPSIGE